jgi:hypothetical protein
LPGRLAAGDADEQIDLSVAVTVDKGGEKATEPRRVQDACLEFKAHGRSPLAANVANIWRRNLT